MPAFTMQTTLPLDIAATPPALPCTIPRTADFTLAHPSSNDASAQFFFEYVDDTSGSPAFDLLCTFPPADTSATVPAAALALIPSQPAGESRGGVYQTVTVHTGGAEVDFELRDYSKLGCTIQ